MNYTQTLPVRHLFKQYEYAIFIEDENHSTGTVGDFIIVDVLEDQAYNSDKFKAKVIKSSGNWTPGHVDNFYSPVFRSIDFNSISLYTHKERVKLLELSITPFTKIYL